MISRRTLLQQAVATLAFDLSGTRPARHLWDATPSELLPPSPDEPRLCELALRAIDAAQAAGAGYADVRVTTVREVIVSSQYAHRSGRGPEMQMPSMRVLAGYGVRALVDGAWGFASGYDLTSDAVGRAGQAAVALARSSRARHRRVLELAPVARVSQGRWRTPITQDPFVVPLGEQADVQLAALGVAADVSGVVQAQAYFGWKQFTQVFASSEGSLYVQRLDRAEPHVAVMAMHGRAGYSQAGGSIPSLHSGGYGYEIVTGADLATEVRDLAERAVMESKALRPPRPVEVGRYDVVFAAHAVGRLLGDTLGKALDLERALGYRANGAGTSFAAPPEKMLGAYQVASPLLTVRGNRSAPHGYNTVGWDDEGVKPENHTVIQDGVIVDYHTNRQTAPVLADWYRQRGDVVRSNGCALGAAQEFPQVGVPNLTLEPGLGTTTEDDLIADTKRGFYVRMHGGGFPDQQLLNGQYRTSYDDVWIIRNGKLRDRISDLGFQFLTPQFWKGLDALGGPASEQRRAWHRYRPWGPGGGELQLDRSTVSAVPIRVRQVNVLNLGRAG